MKNTAKRLYFILSLLSLVLALSIASLLSLPSVRAKAENETLSFSSETYKTAGASVRLWENDGSTLEDGKTGIRFHVLMDATLYTQNKDNPNFKTYTVILPSYLLSGELSFTTENALVLDTTDFWRIYKRDNTYYESVAYVYGLPTSKYATDIAFCGVVSFDLGSTISYQTDTAYRSMAFVAKSARDDTTQILSDETLESKRVSVLNEYIPKYNLIYKVGDKTTYEAVEYGDIPSQMPEGVSIWKNCDGEVIDLTQKVTGTNATSSTSDIELTAYANITINTSNALVNVNGTTVSNGDSIEVKCGSHTISASPNTNYTISNFTVDGNDKGSENSYSVSITKNTTVSITASIITYNITLDNAAGASVSGSVGGTYNINSTCSFTLGTGFYSVTVNGTEIFPSSSRTYSFTVTANSTVKIINLTDAQTKTKLMQIIDANSSVLSISGDTLVSTADTGEITIPQAVFDELKKYGYTTLSFDIYKPQKKELFYKKRIQNVTDDVTVAEVGTYKDSISASVSITKATTFQGQYKSLGSWNREDVGVSWTISNLTFS